MENHLISLGLQASMYGMGGVFLVLILFYIITKGMMAYFQKRQALNPETKSAK